MALLSFALICVGRTWLTACFTAVPPATGLRTTVGAVGRLRFVPVIAKTLPIVPSPGVNEAMAGAFAARVGVTRGLANAPRSIAADTAVISTPLRERDRRCRRCAAETYHDAPK